MLFDLINRDSEAFGIDKETLFVPATTEACSISGTTPSWMRTATIGPGIVPKQGVFWPPLVLLSHCFRLIQALY